MISRLYKVRGPEEDMRNVKESIRQEYLEKRRSNLARVKTRTK